MMKMIALFLLLFPASLSAAEPVSYKDFVEITDSIFDDLDRVQVLCQGTDSSKSEVEKLFKEMDIKMKKYYRHTEKWPKKSIQGEIVYALIKNKLQYQLAIVEGLYGESYDNARAGIDEARRLFIKYKKKHRG